ncbi:MAG: AmpG family muropeptide MFS transporter [Oligoflexia bacterium]|nr:AmpG family muropeptide MFS transporter [Oligoflexia bacterium]
MENFLKVLFSKRMLINLFLGFSSGLPLLLTLTALQAWMKDEGVNLKTIGMVSLIGLPYTLKFLWSPLFDRFVLPVCGLGRRRSWMLVVQILLGLSIAAMAFARPKEDPLTVVILAIIVTFFSASQDIVLDAYRREILSDEELGLGSSIFVNGYRVAMLLASSGALILADNLKSWPTVYVIMGFFMLVGIITTLFADEPEINAPPPKTLQEAVVGPFLDYFKRDYALWILAFILFYKLGDTLASAMSTPFYMDIGFTKSQIGYVVKTFGIGSMLLGTFVGGGLILRLGIYRSLWVFGILQMISILPFSYLANAGAVITLLMVMVVIENFCFGMGTAAFVALMGSMTNRRFTATQYALLSSLMGIPRVILSAPMGKVAELSGWSLYFIICAATAIPGLLILLKVKNCIASSTDDSSV